MVGQHHERRQIVVQLPEAVAHPAAHAGKAGPVEPGRLQQRALRVHAGLADHVVDERHLVHDCAERRDHFAEHLAALAVWLEVPDRPQPRAEAVLKRFDCSPKSTRLAVPLHQFGLEVEQIDVARRARHEQLHDALRLGRMMQRATNAPGVAASNFSLPSKAASAMPPNPPPLCHKNSRRVSRLLPCGW